MKNDRNVGFVMIISVYYITIALVSSDCYSTYTKMKRKGMTETCHLSWQIEWEKRSIHYSLIQDNDNKEQIKKMLLKNNIELI